MIKLKIIKTLIKKQRKQTKNQKKKYQTKINIITIKKIINFIWRIKLKTIKKTKKKTWETNKIYKPSKEIKKLKIKFERWKT
jgi:hypothetical protein